MGNRIVPIDRQIKCVKRELGFRGRLYFTRLSSSG